MCSFKKRIIFFFFLLLNFHINMLGKIDLKESVELAHEHRSDLEGFTYIIRANWHEERAALGGYLPQIAVLVESGKSSEPGPTGSGIAPLPRGSSRMEISQLIFSYDGPLLQYKIAQEETDISRAQKELLGNNIRINTENSFLRTKKILLKQKFINALYNSSQETFDQDKSRQIVGFLNKAEWDRAKFEYSQGQTEIKNYPNDIAEAISSLQRETNIQVKKENISLEYKDLDKVRLEKIGNYQKRAMTNRPDLTELDHRIAQAEYSERYNRYQYIPEISFGFTMQKNRIYDCVPETVFEALPQFDNKRLFWHLGLQLSWRFDGMSSFNISKKFDNLTTNFMLQKRDLELNITKDIEILYQKLTNLLNLLEPAEKKYNAAKTQENNVKKQYSVGLAPLFRYKQAQFTFKQAEFDLMTLKIDIRNNYQRLLFLCGYPPESIYR